MFKILAGPGLRPRTTATQSTDQPFSKIPFQKSLEGGGQTGGTAERCPLPPSTFGGDAAPPTCSGSNSVDIVFVQSKHGVSQNRKVLVRGYALLLLLLLLLLNSDLGFL